MTKKTVLLYAVEVTCDEQDEVDALRAAHQEMDGTIASYLRSRGYHVGSSPRVSGFMKLQFIAQINSGLTKNG